MDIYFFSLILGVLGLAVMATFGLGRHSHSGGGHGHGGGHGGSHGHGPGHAAGGHASFGAGSRAAGWILMSPRLLFAGLLGFGAVGVALNSMLDGVLLFVVALAGGIALERLLFNPIWKLSMRFASNPANTIESTITGDAIAVSNFDKNGQGIISMVVDGHVQQVLGTLQKADRAAGVVVRAGERVRIEDVDGARQRCTVSKL